jgi:ribosomal protein S18 acetylase RimI-like enzyme
MTADELAELFASIDSDYFHPHPFTRVEAERIVNYSGRDIYLVHSDASGRPVAYGMLRGWDEGYTIPSLGIGVRSDAYGQGHGRRMMEALHAAARERGAPSIRLRVHPDNARARGLYDSLGYREAGRERGEILMVLEL